MSVRIAVSVLGGFGKLAPWVSELQSVSSVDGFGMVAP